MGFEAQGVLVEQHVKILAILHIVLGSLGVLAALTIMVVFGGIAGLIHVTNNSDVPAAPIIGLIGGVLMIIILVLSFPGIIVGIGLLNFRSWARILAIVLSVLDLIHIPFGTALGIYGLWVLLSPQAEPLFRRGTTVTRA